MDRLRSAGVTDPLLREAIDFQARRLASHREVAGLRVGCRRFNRLTRRIRELPTRTPRQIVRADYASGPRARRIERNVSNALRRIVRRASTRVRIDARVAAVLRPSDAPRRAPDAPSGRPARRPGRGCAGGASCSAAVTGS